MKYVVSKFFLLKCGSDVVLVNVSLVNDKYGYVENVDEEYLYKNIDYRDTTAPLWNTLYKKIINKQLHNEQDEINLALCAAIIKLSKFVNYKSDVLNEKIKVIEKSISLLNAQIISLTEKLSK